MGQKLLEAQEIELVCFGLDTLTEIYMNGELLAKTDNMHRTWRFSVKEMLKAGTNHIQIRFLSTLRYIQNYQAQEHKEIHCDASGAISGNQYLRKAHSMFGWDWGAQLPDAGISVKSGWRRTVLQGLRAFSIHSVIERMEVFF